MHQYRVLLRVLAASLSLVIGVAVAWTFRDRPPASAPSPRASAVLGLPSSTTETTQALPVDEDQTGTASKAPKATPKSSDRKKAQLPTPSNYEVKVPVATAKSTDDDTDLLPRSPTSTVTLELAKAGLKRVTIRQGALDRDGPSQHPKWVQAPTITSLSGSQVSVRVLHYGYDSEGEVTALHVQTLEEPAKQGMINLLPKGKRIPLSH